MKRMLENYLRCYFSLRQDDWDNLLTAAEFSYNSPKITSLGMSPFEINIGWNPKSPLDSLTTHNSSSEGVNEFLKHLSAAYESSKFAQQIAAARYSAHNAAKFSPVNYSVGERVLLSRRYFTDHLSNIQPSKKLGSRRYGPFHINDIVGKMLFDWICLVT